MKYLFVTASLLFAISCNSKKNVTDPENLPKDISLKPEGNIQEYDRETLRTHLSEIEMLAQSQSCENADDWTYAAIGSKPCGGPSSYIAFPKNIQSEILPKIRRFNEMSSAFNKKYGLMSDCMMVTEPAGIICEDGKPKLVRESTLQQAAE